MIDANTALLRLKEGNKKFRNGTTLIEVDEARRFDVVEKQSPFAIILGCSDSRVPLELIFCQGLGDLFVIRVAGNVATPSQIGSIEFAAEKFGTKLVVVLGHTSCGAIKAALEDLDQENSIQSPNLKAIVDSIKPGIKDSISDLDSYDEKIQKAVRANVQTSINNLINESEILRQLRSESGLKIIGADYCLESGIVEFL
jgi:carbonic anhydrase|tara:strand:- start:1977 stop:2573 length:597 start_codon:yes stop_codon:yes gene_type:complete